MHNQDSKRNGRFEEILEAVVMSNVDFDARIFEDIKECFGLCTIKWHREELRHSASIDSGRPLRHAIDHHDLSVINALIESRALLDAHDHKDRTPLHHAARISHHNRRLRLIEMLVEVGGGPAATDHSGKTPFDYIN